MQSEEHGKSGMGVVDRPGGEKERPQLGAVKAAGVVGWTLGRGTYWAGLETILPSMWARR